jgi:hypothetical protein
MLTSRNLATMTSSHLQEQLDTHPVKRHEGRS